MSEEVVVKRRTRIRERDDRVRRDKFEAVGEKLADKIFKDMTKVMVFKLENMGFKVEEAVFNCWLLCKDKHPKTQLTFFRTILPYLRPSIKAEEWSRMLNPDLPQAPTQNIVISLSDAREIARSIDDISTES